MENRPLRLAPPDLASPSREVARGRRHRVAGRLRTFMAILPFLAGVLAVTPASLPAQSVEELVDRFLDAWNSEDVEAVEAMLTDDAVYWNAGQELEGPEEILGSWAAAMEATDRMTFTPLRSRTGEDLAFQGGHWAQWVGDTVVEEGAYTFVFSRSDDGSWNLASAHVERGGANGR